MQSPGFVQRHAQEFANAATIAAPPSPSPLDVPPPSPAAGPTICMPRKEPPLVTAAAKVEEQVPAIEATQNMETAVEIDQTSTNEVNSAAAVAAESTQSSTSTSDGLDSSYELVEHQTDGVEPPKLASPQPPSPPAPPSMSVSDPALELTEAPEVNTSAPVASDNEPPIDATVTPPLPANSSYDHVTLALHNSISALSMASSGGGMQESAPMSPIDADHLLAMELQEQEDRLAAQRAAQQTSRPPIYGDDHGHPHTHSHTSGGEYGCAGESLLSQEEQDREHALKLHYQEVHAAEQQRALQRAQAAGPSARQSQQPPSGSRAGSGGGHTKKCIIC